MTVGGVPRWGVASAIASPLLLIGGWTVAARLQPSSFNQVSETVSSLAAVGASDRWVMTLVFVLVGVCDVVTGIALRPVPFAGRMIMIAGAIMGMLVAAYPEHPGGGSIPHTLWATLAFIALAVWPAWARRRDRRAPWALRPAACAAAVAVQAILLAWFLAELAAGSSQTGLAERAVGVAQALWPLVVVLSCRAAVRPARLTRSLR